MYIESIQLKNYRNYKSLLLNPDSQTNILYGDNAQGKTNVLEAIYLCGTTKSHRGSKDREIIQFEEEDSHIRISICKKQFHYRIDMHLKKNKPKGVAINGIPIKKVRELFGIVNIVFFSPEDLNIIKNGPGERRRFIDLELCQLNAIYLTDLANYNRIVNQRNKLLKDMIAKPKLKETLEIWDLQMVQFGEKIIEARRTFINQLNEIIQDIHKQLTGGLEQLELVYEPNVQEGEFSKALMKNREKDLRLRLTTSGPHRDDLCVKVNGIDLRKYGSQGQQRTAALSLKLSEIYLVKQIIKDTPILLLDDVLSELDSNRQNYLLNSIHDIQTFITCTGVDEFVNNRFHIDKMYHVVNGTIQVPD